jgi:hypothetical protein
MIYRYVRVQVHEYTHGNEAKAYSDAQITNIVGLNPQGLAFIPYAHWL